MITYLWYRRSWLNFFFLPFAGLFALITWLRRKAYQAGFFKSYKAPVPIIIVGNITAGGNGKTPTVLWLAELLRQSGFKPGVVSRGYGGKAPYYPYLLSDKSEAKETGDEPLLIFQRLKCPVAIAPKRAEAVKLLLSETDINIVICDDGLQHYALQRDIELVVIDGERRLGNGWLMPMGPLRESVSRLAHVDAIICNGGKARPNEVQMTLKPAPLRRLTNNAQVQVSGAVDAMAGIGYPPRFFNTLHQCGYALNQQIAYQDHQNFDEAELISRFKQRPLIMTEKDAVKCRRFAQGNWYYLPVDAILPTKFEAKLISKIRKLTNGSRL